MTMEALSHKEAMALLAEIGANEREHSLKAILGTLQLTFDGAPLRLSVGLLTRFISS